MLLAATSGPPVMMPLSDSRNGSGAHSGNMKAGQLDAVAPSHTA